MIFLPVLFVLAAAPVGRVHEVLAERLEARELTAMTCVDKPVRKGSPLHPADVGEAE